MLIKDRTYSEESCSTVTTISSSTPYPNAHTSTSGWQNIGTGQFFPESQIPPPPVPAKVFHGGTTGDGARFNFELEHNNQEVSINLSPIDLTNLNTGSSLTIQVYDSAGVNLIYSVTIPSTTMIYFPPPITFLATTCSTGYHIKFMINSTGSGEWVELGNLEIKQDIASQMQVCGEVDYRFGFNGQEKDNEKSGLGNTLVFEYRIHDTRLGRFLSVDPLEKEYPYYSTYAFAGNRVIDRIELEGAEPGIPGLYNDDYRVALKHGTSINYGWTWSAYSKSWRPENEIQFSVGSINNNAYDLQFGDLRGVQANSNTFWITNLSLSQSNGILMGDFRFGVVSGTIWTELETGKRLVRHFERGGGAKLDWSEGSTLSGQIGSDERFINMANTFEGSLTRHYSIHQDLCGFSSRGTLGLIDLNGFDNLFLMTTIGGTQKIEVQINSIQKPDNDGVHRIGTMNLPTIIWNPNYTYINLTYTISDIFGAGAEDETKSINGVPLPGLNSMFVLQHYRSDGTMYRPFVNSIKINRTIKLKNN